MEVAEVKESGKFPQTFDLLNRLGSTQLQCLGEWGVDCFFPKEEGLAGGFKYFQRDLENG